jgi:hypothetical protein
VEQLKWLKGRFDPPIGLLIGYKPVGILRLCILQVMQNFPNAFEFCHLFILQFGKISERLVVNLRFGVILRLALVLTALQRRQELSNMRYS